jgi:serine/threonine protein kinase
MSAVLAQDKETTIGRFRLIRTLGQGAQGVVHLVNDPQLERQVALKTLLLQDAADTTQAEELIRSARIASSLSHPNIVPVFDVGMHEGKPYIVFEYVEGKALSDLLRAEGALPMARAVIMMSQILGGVAAVHAGGLLHGDIKPANILIGANAVPRVTDFGISRRVHKEGAAPVTSGTVKYMAPECFEKGSADYRSDVFALGLLFHEMLTGEAVYRGRNDYNLIYKILNEPPPPPSTRNPRVDQRIDEIVMKALHRDPDKRYADAAEMKRDLDRYRVPSQASAAELKEQTLHSTAEFLLRRMALKSDFPALSASFSRINQIAGQADDASIKAIADLVMRDFALTQKLLRVVNSAAFGAGKVTKVSQAISMLGLSQLRALATGLMLANGGNAGQSSPEVAALLTDAFVAGVIARNVGRMIGMAAVEELFICGMFLRLGELLALYYLKEENDEIKRRMHDERMDSDTASREVLGLTFDQLGAEVAKNWNFPATIIAAMQPLDPGTIVPRTSEAHRMQYCAGYARELCDSARTFAAAIDESTLSAHVTRFAAVVPVPNDRLHELIAHTVDVALKYVAATGLKVTNTAQLDGLNALKRIKVNSDVNAPADRAADQADTPTVRNLPAPQAAEAPATTEPPAPRQPNPPRAALTTRLANAWRSMF